MSVILATYYNHRCHQVLPRPIEGQQRKADLEGKMVHFKSSEEIEENNKDHVCFDTLLMWVKAMIAHYKIYEKANEEWLTKVKDVPRDFEERIKHFGEAREMRHVFTRARHDMLSAAQQVYLSRNWAVKRKLVPETVFKRFNHFQNDVGSLRNMHQHHIEYLKGKGDKPDEWTFHGDAWSVDASSTLDGLWGARLNPKELGEAAENLLPILVPLDPEMIERRKMFARIELRGIWRDRQTYGSPFTEDDLKVVSERLKLAIDVVKEQATEVEAEFKPAS